MTSCMTCPDPQNYAAVALQLQNTALQAESCLFTLERQLRNGTNPLTTILSSIGAESVASGSLRDLGITSFNSVWSNWDVTALVGLGPNLPPGVYQVGASIQVTAAGAVNDNSLRLLQIRVQQAGSPTTTPPDFSDEITMYEPNNGNGSDMTLTTTVTLNGHQDLLFSFAHDNVASLMNVAAGARYWWTKLSDQVALRTV